MPVPSHPTGRFPWTSLEIPHRFQPPLIVLLAPHQDRTKQGRRCNHSTWFLVDLWIAFAWMQPTGFAPSIFLEAFWSRDPTSSCDLCIRRRGLAFREKLMFNVFTLTHKVQLAHWIQQGTHACKLALTTLITSTAACCSGEIQLDRFVKCMPEWEAAKYHRSLVPQSYPPNVNHL